MFSDHLYHSADDIHILLHHAPAQALPWLARALHKELQRLARLDLPEGPQIFGDNANPHFEASVGACVARHLITPEFGRALYKALDICATSWEIDPNPQPVSATRRDALTSLVFPVATHAVFQQYEFENVGPWLMVNHLKTCVCVMVILIRDRAKRPAIGFAPQSSPWG